MVKPELLSFVTGANIRLHADFYRAGQPRKEVTVLYYHGGGLLYGTRDDLSPVYIDRFLQAGYDFLALDYPLAPESTLDAILSASFELLDFYLKKHGQMLGLRRNAYVLFGRSAGAYLALMLCARAIQQRLAPPAAVVSLYGYGRLTAPEFVTPSRYYTKLAPVAAETLKMVIAAEPVTYGPMNLRFSLYVKARQDGSWLSLLGGAKDPAAYSLTADTLAAFPPAFLAAASFDPDVPYKLSKELSRQIPGSHLITLYREVHDFDRDAGDPDGQAVYRQIIDWLAEQTAAAEPLP
ncbi:MAG: alpha/beta hydrolase [Sporomusaceae bacterium]|nr:alpha/beta hydrolase [Sporomusaceae bacterium]